MLDRYEQEWNVAREEVERERERRNLLSTYDEPPEAWLATLGEPELRALLARVPYAVLRKLHD